MKPVDARPQLQAFNGFLAKSDGKDKLTALIQYACMFISAGEPGNAKKIQASVAAARKVFRVFRPLESVMPIINSPSINPNKPLPLEILAKLKALLMGVYFAADHVVWASQAGIYTNKENIDRWQKVSLWSWFGGSGCTIVTELTELARLLQRRPKESEAEWNARRNKSLAEIDARLLTLVHASFQAALAVGLLQLRPWKPRFVGLLGIIASAMNCYMLMPAVVRAPVVGKPKSDPLPQAPAPAKAEPALKAA
ncbi:hypothetical protein WJX73_001456 [Symbiochloris irregularis]|uniref:Peroxisomal membrane protein 11C n=1 Tax=Symbiochloris irregularis TaxID=706552 RepID=A0AAW1PYI8_9CHLO